MSRAPLRVLLVDDERLARAELRRLLTAHPEVAIVGEAANAEEALRAVAAHSPDLVFLDIQMPGADGLAVAAGLEGRCPFVFCTAHDRHAVDAFRLEALDYLLKPVAPERLARVLERVAATTGADEAPRLPLDHPLLLQFGERARVVRLREIDRFQSVGNHAAVYCQHGKAYLLSALSRIERRLDPLHYFRVSRSDILRLDAIRSLEADVGGGLIALLVDGSRVAVSRRQAQLLRAQLGGWN